MSVSKHVTHFATIVLQVTVTTLLEVAGLDKVESQPQLHCQKNLLFFFLLVIFLFLILNIKVEEQISELRGSIEGSVEDVKSMALLKRFNSTHSVLGTR